MKIIGITGGIGSGKSTVSYILRDLGAKVIDADFIARVIVSKGEKAFEEIVEFFGSEVVNENGELNRKKLSDIVFTDVEKLEALNNITHKYIAERIIQNIDRLKAENAQGIIVIDAPIPIEHGFIDMVDEIWVVTADKDVRIKRIMNRSDLSCDEAINRIDSQKKDEFYLTLADEVIHNNGDIEDLEKSIAKLFIQKKLGDIIE